MKRCRNRGGKSGVASHEAGEGFLRIRFIKGGTPEYTDASRFVNEKYARKLD